MLNIGNYFIPIFIALVVLFAFLNKKNAYEAFTVGASEGIKIALSIFPFLLVMLFATTILKGSLILLDLFGSFDSIPKELILQGLFRPLSSNGSLSFMLEIYAKYEVDSKLAIASSVLQGSTDTTLYVITLYFGSKKITSYKWAVILGLTNDLFCFLMALFLYYFIL